MSSVLKHVVAIAKGLNKAELHVLIELASRAEAADSRAAAASSRELAEATGLARSSVQLAIDSLHRKGVIYSDAGTATRSALYHLLFLDAVENEINGPIVRPEVARESGQSGLKSGPAVAQILGQSGPIVRPVMAGKLGQSGLNSGPVVAQVSSRGGLDSGPLSDEKSITCEHPNKENASAPADSIENDFDKLIDRLQKSKKSDFDDEVFEEARKLIASHHAKFAREGFQITGLPDDQITAQFLAVAEWPRLSHLVWDLMSERKASGHSYAWYVTVALQRIHGIPPDQVREIRSKLKSPYRDPSEPGFKGVTESRSIAGSPISGRQPGRFAAYGRSSVDMETLKQQIRAVAVTRSMP